VKSPNRSSHLVERIALELKANASPEAAALLGDAANHSSSTRSKFGAAPTDDSLNPQHLLGPTHKITTEQLRSAGMVRFQQRGERIGEEFRLASHNIRQAYSKLKHVTGHNVVMVTSACPAEGKSFAALNLAGALSDGGDKPVLLVDGDIRERSLTQLLGCADTPGMLDIPVSPQQLMRSLTIRADIKNLSFLPIGGNILDGSGSSNGPSITSLLHDLSKTYSDHLIVLDAPPSLANSDPSSFAAIVGQIILVVEAGKTRRKEVENALDVLDACPQISLLLNRITARDKGTFGTYS
jgi:protein-tyrosine kinase